MKKILLILFGLILILILVLVAVWFNLGWILNEENLRRGRDAAKLDLQWEKLDLEVQNRGWNGKFLYLQSQNLCLRHPRPHIDICLQTVHVEFELYLKLTKPFAEVRDLILETTSSKVLVEIPEKKEEPVKPFQWPRLELGPLDSFLAKYLALIPQDAIKKIDVHVPSAQIILLPDTTIKASADLQSPGDRVTVRANTEIGIKAEPFLKAGLQAEMSLRSPARLDGQGRVELPKLPLAVDFKLSWLDVLQLTADSQMQFKKTKIKASLKAEARKELWKLGLVSSVTDPRLPFKEFAVHDCNLNIKVSKGVPSSVDWPCIAEASKIRKLPLKGLPDSLRAHFQVRSPLQFAKDIFKASPQLEIRMQEEPLVRLSADGKAQTEIDLTHKKLNHLRVEQLEVLLDVPGLENWQKLLKKSAWSLPAPLHVLKGPLQLKVSGEPTDILNKVFDIHSTLMTDLTSPRQALKTNSQVNLHVDLQKPFISMDGDVALKEITLELPYLGFETPPQFKPDGRFVREVKTVKKKTGPPVFAIKDLALHTEEKPIRLHTRLLDEPIPLHVKYRIQNTKSISGIVSIGKMNVEVFKKKAVVERFNIKKYPDSTVQDLDGLITHKTSEVKIEILIVGTTEKPHVELLSDPPLSRQQIISILLFNKSLQELTDEDKNTAGQLDQALLSEAFGLASLFLLSSTPIESVYFDPRTQSYTARVRLDDNTSLSVGSNFESSQQFTLRRRLGGPWSVSTELRQTDNADDIITTLIEWFKRF